VCSGRVISCHASRAFGKTRKAEERDGYEGLSPEICKTREEGEMKFHEEADSCWFHFL
jgi:hypothetical protein